jgi:hypothetical protein
MPEKRARNKPARKGSKELVHHRVNDLRRAYEQLGRIELLEGALAGSRFVDVTELTSLAHQQLAAGYTRNAADLLRAAEHMCFAALAPNRSSEPLIGSDLRRAVAIEFEGLMRRAEEQWEEENAPPTRRVIEDLFARALDQARSTFDRGSYRPALELARAAEALSHVGDGLPAALPDRGFVRQLAS